MTPASETENESIGGLFSRLADNASDLVRAEIELHRAALLHRVALSRPALIGLVAALLLVQGAVICLLVMLAIGLSHLVGPVWAGLIVTLATLALAGVIALASAKRLQAAASIKVGEGK